MSDARSPLFELTRIRVLEFVRDVGALFWVFGFPIVLAIALGVAFRSRPPEPARVAVVVEAGRPSTTADALRAAGGFEVRALTADEADRALKSAAVDLVVVGGSPPVYRFDEQRPEARHARLAVDAALQRAAGRADVLQATDEKVTLAGSRYIDFLLPGLIGMNLLGSSMWGTGYSVVDARRRKLLKRYAATPMRRWEYLLSVVLARVVFLLLEIVAFVAIGEVFFGVHVQGGYGAVLVACLVGGMSFTGLALLIAARAKSAEVASGLVNFLTLPMWLLSGSFFSSARFPEAAQPLIQALPLTALNDALRGIYNDGASLLDVSGELGILLAWGLLPFVVAVRWFRWQ
jgi:ABC-2 type transport system permease protein